jgi:hypothetical protein
MAAEDLRDHAERIVLDAQHPWPSLHAFTTDHQAHFRGRDDEVDEIVRRIRRKLLTVLFGTSGLGKTSLLQAGVIPRLTRTDFVPILIRLDHRNAEVDLVEQVRDNIRHQIKERRVDVANDIAADESLWSFFHRVDADWYTRRRRRLNAVLIFDQFEEIFSSPREGASGETERRRFFLELAALVENRPPQEVRDLLDADPEAVGMYDFAQDDYRVVISMREDYLPHLEDLSHTIPSIMENRFRLGRMTEDQALEAVVEPGRTVVNPLVAREIVAFVAGSVDAESASSKAGVPGVDPALLSLMCSELNEQRLGEGAPMITAELLRGRSGRILDDFYLRCFDFLYPEQRGVARAFVEDRLLTPHTGLRGTIAVETAEAEMQALGVPKEALHELVKRRLLQFDERHGLRRVELAHDILTKVVREHRDRRHESERAAKLRERERQALEDSKNREQIAAAEIKRLRKGRITYAAVGLVFAILFAMAAGGVIALGRKQKELEQKQEELVDNERRLETERKRLEILNEQLIATNREATQARETIEKVIDGVTAAVLNEIGEGAQVGTLQSVLKSGLAAFDSMPQEAQTSPDLQIKRAKLLNASAKGYIKLGIAQRYAEARKAAEEAVRIVDDVYGSRHEMAGFDSVAFRLTLGDVLRLHANALENVTSAVVQAEYQQAEHHYTLALQRAEELLQRAMNSSLARESLVLCLMSRGDLAKDQSMRNASASGVPDAEQRRLLAEAQKIYEKAFAECNNINAGDGRQIGERLLADLYNKIGNIYALRLNQQAGQRNSEREQQFEQAKHNYMASLKIRRDLVSRYRNIPSYKRSLGYTLTNLGGIHETKWASSNWTKAAERPALAREIRDRYEERLEIAKEISAADPQNAQYRADLGEAYRHLVRLHTGLKDHDQALVLCQEWVKATQGRSGDALQQLVKAATIKGQTAVAAAAQRQREQLESEPKSDAPQIADGADIETSVTSAQRTADE